ncbi:Probable bacterial non-heme ferritin-like protein [Chlamydiales bacterium SCGC AG-110-M15]|nr:Probable bacterial non-heme ferritin-like protein [Chlamydiales bacterium SCGC AG-110-M15]
MKHKLLTLSLAASAFFGPDSLAYADLMTNTDLDPFEAISKKRRMSEEMHDALNKQLKEELNAAYMYLSMSVYCDQQGLEGFASWFHMHANEEMEHATRFMNFMRDRGAEVKLPALAAPKTDYASPLEAFQTALAHEQDLSLKIHDLYGLTQELKEYDAGAFVMWFLQEQVEEENLFSNIAQKLIMLQDGNKGHILTLDKELGERQK